MAERKSNIKYYFTVEGECEELYLDRLQTLINSEKESLYTVEIKSDVTSNLLKTAKNINPVTVPKTIYHLCDVEGIEDGDKTRFQDYLKDLKSVKNQKGLKYELGYSNFTFELWMVLHKMDCYGCLTHKGQYLSFINKVYGQEFNSLKTFKKKENFKKCLAKIELSDIKGAIKRSKIIMKKHKENGDREISFCTYKYFEDNPALTIWESVEKILEKCKLLQKD